MKNVIWMSLFVGMISFVHAGEGDTPIPADATVIRTLDCEARFGGDFADVTRVSFKDVTFKNSQVGFQEFAGTVSFAHDGGKSFDGRLNAANGLDPEENRDAPPSNHGGFGGLAVYELSGTRLALMTLSSAPQKGLAQRNYRVAIVDVTDENQEPKLIAEGALECTATNQ